MRALAVWPWLKPAWYWFTNDDEAEREIRSGRMLVFFGWHSGESRFPLPFGGMGKAANTHSFKPLRRLRTRPPLRILF